MPVRQLKLIETLSELGEFFFVPQLELVIQLLLAEFPCLAFFN